MPQRMTGPRLRILVLYRVIIDPQMMLNIVDRIHHAVDKRRLECSIVDLARGQWSQVRERRSFS